MSYVDIKDAYERKFIEILLRHELPEDCEVSIELEGPAKGEARFAVKGPSLSVKSNIGDQNLARLVAAENW